MKSVKRVASSSLFDSTSSLRNVLLGSLSKLNSPTTIQIGYSELRQLIPPILPSQLPTLIHMLDANDITKHTKKEYIKVIGLVAELRGHEIVDLLPRIVMMINRRIQEGDSSLTQAISDTFANLNEYVIQPSHHKYDLFLQTVEALQGNFTHNNKIAQQISAAAIYRLIQTSEVQLLEYIFKAYTLKTLEIIRSPHCRTNQGLLESLLSLILSVEELFEVVLDETITTIQSCFTAEEWNSRKVSMDIVYTLSVIFPTYFQHNEQLIQIVSEMRFDKIKHVRDAALIALSSLKESKVTQSRQYKSIFKMNANKEFFDRKSDIEIVENKPKEQQLKSYDTQVQTELHTSNKKQYPSAQKEYHQQPQLHEEQDRLYTSQYPLSAQQPQYEQIQSPYRNADKLFLSYLAASQSPASAKKRELSQSSVPEVLKSPSPIKDIQKLINSTKQKQSQLLEAVQNQYNNQSNQSNQPAQQEHLPVLNVVPVAPIMDNQIKLEFANINRRMDKIELMLTKLCEAQNNSNRQEQQGLHQQQQTEQQMIMSKIESAIERKNYNEAYSTALTSMDDQIIVATMLRTGPCSEMLDSTQVEFLLHKLRTLDWIENALEHHLSKMPTILLKSICNQLKTLPQTDQVQRLQQRLQQ